MAPRTAQCGGDTSSCPGPYPTTACAEFHIGSRLGRELFTLLSPIGLYIKTYLNCENGRVSFVDMFTLLIKFFAGVNFVIGFDPQF